MYINGFFQTDVLVKFFIPFRPAKAITRKILSQQSGIPVLQKRDTALPGWNFLYEIAKFNLWRIYNTAGIPGKTGQNFILASQDHAITT